MRARQGEMFPRPQRRQRVQRMHVVDAGDCGTSDAPRSVVVQMRCMKCGHLSGWLKIRTVTEAKRGLPCPHCNATVQR